MTEDNPLRNAGPTLSPNRIAELEAQLGATLPDDYRQFLLECNGGSPTKAMFSVRVGPAPTWMAEKWRAKWSEQQEPWIDDFCVIDEHLAGPNPNAPTGSLAFWRAADWLMLPPDALPIAVVTRDDILLLYLRGSRRGEVHLRCEEYLDAAKETTPQDVEAAIRFVSPSFAEFYRALTATDESDS